MVENFLNINEKQAIKLTLSPTSKLLDLPDFLQKNLDIAYITPSHQYPFGGVLDIEQRQQLLQWVKQKETRYLIEDDYDGEFRYKGKPIPSLQSLDNADKVIYFGSFSKLLMPSIRISFMVLPKPLLPQYEKIAQCINCSVSRLDQQIVTQFMKQGFFEQHINRMRKYYRHKMEALCRIIARYPNNIRYYGESSGFYLLIELLNESRTLEQLTELARKEKIKVYPISWRERQFFVIGFGDLDVETLECGMIKLLRLWGLD